MSDIEVGQRWYVKLPNDSQLIEVDVEEITELTVLFKIIRYSPQDVYLRYIFDEVVFVEAC